MYFINKNSIVLLLSTLLCVRLGVGIIFKPSIYANIPKTRAFDEKPSNIIDKTLLGYCKAFFCYYLLATVASNDWATGFF